MEEPLVGMAHLNSLPVLAGTCCSRCLRPIGSIQEAWALTNDTVRSRAAAARNQRLQKKQSKGKAKAAQPEEASSQLESQVDMADLPLPVALPFFSHDTSSAADLPSILRLPQCSAIPCSSGCGSVYCSEKCRDLAWQHSHELLCRAGGAGVDAAFSSLQKHAASKNEIFLLAAQAVACMTLQALRNMQQSPAVRQLLASTGEPSADGLLSFGLQLHYHMSTLSAAEAASLRNELEACTIEACAPFQRFCGAIWWERVSIPASIDPEDEAEYRQGLCGVAEQSLSKIAALAQAKVRCSAAPGASDAEWDDIVTSLRLEEAWSISTFGHVLSSFERNNIGFHAPTLLGLYVAHVRSLPEELQSKAIRELGPDVWDAMQLRSDGVISSDSSGATAASPAGIVEGTGLFVIGCCMNHSCSPNITLRQKAAPIMEGASELHEAELRARTQALLDKGASSAKESAAASIAAPSASSAAPVSLPSSFLDRSCIFVAERDIHAGDELCISYIDLLQETAPADRSATSAKGDSAVASADAATMQEVPRAVRQQELRAYDFACHCEKCTSEADSSK
jgi:hypothetical protein